jgi:hypothetical protein
VIPWIGSLKGFCLIMGLLVTLVKTFRGGAKVEMCSDS